MSDIPTILLAFANNSETPLEQLSNEDEAIYKSLISLQKQKEYVIHRESNATRKTIFNRIVDSKDQLVLFHFAGHANSEKLFLRESKANASGIIELLSQQNNLKLIFLNGCSTEPQVDQILKSGIPSVIATSVPVNDSLAFEFAEAFYSVLIEGYTLGESFDHAVGFLSTGEGKGKKIHRGGLNLGSSTVELPWGIYYNNEDILSWKLTEEEGVHKIPRKLTSIPSINVEEDVIGRADDIQRLAEILQSSKKPVVLNGIGGIGKTVLAKSYLQIHGDSYKHLAWIERADDLSAAFVFNKDLLENLRIDISEIKDEKEIIRKLMNTVRNLAGPNLLVLDNADEQINSIAKLLPDPPEWQVLITSRQRFRSFFELDLGVLDSGDAKALFFRHYSGGEDDSELDSLLEFVGYHTLTIELLAKTLENHFGTLSVNDLFDHLKNRALDDDEVQRVVEISHSEEETELYKHLIKSFDLVQFSDPEIHLLKQFVLLPPTQVPYADLVKLLNVPSEKQKEFSNTLISLNRKGRITLFPKEKAFQVHRMIREILYYQLNPSIEDAVPVIRSVSGLLSVDQAKDNPIEKFKWIPYGQALLNQFPNEDNADKNTLKNNLATVYQDLGQYEKAAELLESALASALRNFGVDHTNVVKSQSNLATAYRDLGQYEKAAELLESALESDLRNFGKDHPNVARNQSNLALVYKDLGQYEKAAELLESALASDLRNFGVDHPNVAKRQSNLALVYKDLGQYEKAAELLESALASDLRNFGVDHPNVARNQSNLALVYQDLGQYEKAAELLESALESDLHNFGKDHPNVAIFQSNLATVYQALGQYEKATELLESALASDLRNFGKDHPNVARNQSNLATVYQALGQYEKAAELLESALESDLHNFGKDHPNVAVFQSNLATVYQALGQYEKAAELLESALASDLRNFGKDHPNVATSQSNLATVYQDLEQYEKAAELLESALESDLRNFGKDHPNVARSQSNLAAVYQDLGKYEKAAELFKKSYDTFLFRFGPDHPNTKTVKTWLDIT